MVCSRLLVAIMVLWLGMAPVWAEDGGIDGPVDGPTSQGAASVSDDVQHHRYWRQTSLLQYVGDHAASDNLPDTLQLEYRLASRAMADIYERWQARLDDDSEGLNRYRDLISTMLILALAIGAFAGLHRLAKRSTATLLNIHNLIIARAPKQRWVKALARPFSGIAPLAPWILLWLMLTGFTRLFSGSNAALLHWWAPLAELYIVYGLLSLSGEWLLLRISSGAGVFLGGEQNKQLANHTRSHARWMIWPWIILYIIDHWIGPSLTYRVAELGAWLVSWFAIASLLKIRRQDYQVNLKRLLSQRLDPIVERVLSPRGFIWSATLLLPLQILLFVLQYLDMLLSDFDWYRSLSARWFRMRTKVLVEQDGEEISTEEVPQQYERWFTPEGDGEINFPVIDTGLMDAIRKPLDLWLDGRSDENALLVAGEKGIGKSAALARLEKFILKEKQDLVVHRLTIPAKTTSREAVYKLIGDLIGTDVSDGPSELARTDAERTPTIIMLDEAQNLFLAEVGHLDGWRGLLNLTNVRVENLFWIVSINNQSWAYLCNVFGREYQMRNAIRVKRWSQNEIRSLILSRNHLSGFKLQYDDILLTSRGPDAGNLRNAEQRFFSLLWDSCRGIPMTALEMWLTSIRPGERTVTVGLPQVPGSGVLEKLGPKLMFVYAAVVTHENLTFEEILKVTNQQENVVRYALKSALDAEFMQRSDEGRYRITPLWYNTVISYLTRKNMLHE
ncbi:MAG: ATP-binding protein [Alcanivoracaceae bacterium]|nr:ATP-binding protein [Alcanivoracaceae bacterium]